jgi:DNA-binding ferritin-like protein (Dps family)
MAENDPGNDPGNQGNQGGDPGSQGNQGGAPPAGGAPMTINAELLGEFKDDPAFKPFIDKPFGEVFKSFKHAQSMVGGEKVALPVGKLDTPESWNFLFDKLGRPKDADGYKFDKPELPEGVPHDETLEKQFKATCHATGILPKQAAAIYALWNKAQADAYNAFNEAENKRSEVTGELLRKELGTKERYDEYVAGAKAALNRFGGAPEEVQAFVDKFGNDPLVVKVFGNVAKGMMEDAALRGDKSFNLMGEDAPAAVKDIMTNKDNKLNAAYWDKKNPQHDYAVAEVTRLQEVIHGNKPINMAG